MWDPNMYHHSSWKKKLQHDCYKITSLSQRGLADISVFTSDECEPKEEITFKKEKHIKSIQNTSTANPN